VQGKVGLGFNLIVDVDYLVVAGGGGGGNNGSSGGGGAGGYRTSFPGGTKLTLGSWWNSNNSWRWRFFWSWSNS
jgi:hypothetical protein